MVTDMNKGSVNRNAMVAIIIVILCSVGVQAIPDNTTTLCVITDRQCYCTGESVQIAVSGIPPLNDTGINLTVISRTMPITGPYQISLTNIYSPARR